MKFYIKVIFCLIIPLCDSYKILGLFPHSPKSHFLPMQPLLKQLSLNHDVTVVSHFPLTTPTSRYTDVSLEGTLPVLVEKIDLKIFLDQSRIGLYNIVNVLSDWANATCEAVYSSGRLKTIIKTIDSYDVIIVEMFNSDCLLPINTKFKVPVIGMSSCLLLPWTYSRFGIPNNPSYIQNILMDYPRVLNFLQRLENSLITWFDIIKYRWINERDYVIARSYLGEDTPHISNFINNVSLMLVNTHFSLNYPRPYPPNVIEIGGIHLNPPRKLPKNIEKFINESAHGVIYFSLGSMIKGHTFPQEKREEFLKAFARLPQRVLWKWENETMPGKPENVMIQKWMPQFDILSHPNVKAFISHGGLLGTTEAVHCGVPMLVMPQYGDQHTNAKAIEANGGGVILHLKEATEEKVYQSLKTILEPEFRAKTKALSERFRDRPMSPMDTAIYWVEYVARHKGAPHMRTAAVDMPLYQYLLLDVIGFLAVILLASLYITYKIASLILRALFSKKKVKQN